MYKNESITSVLFLIFIIPLIALCQEWIKNLTTIRVAWGLYYSAITIGVSLWFFWRGLQSGNKRESKLTKKNSMGLITLSVAAYLIHVVLLYIGKIDLCSRLSDYLGIYFSEMLVFRFPVLLYGIVFFVLGVFISGSGLKLSGRKSMVYSGICFVIYMLCCVGAELTYYGLDDLHTSYALIHAVSVFPLVGLLLSVYGLAGKDYKIEKYKGLADFMEYLCPSAIFVYVLNLYSSPVLVLLYIVVMWVIYKKFKM